MDFQLQRPDDKPVALPPIKSLGIAGASVMTPQSTRPPSSNGTSRSSSRMSSPRPSITSIASSTRNGSVGSMGVTAESAAKDLRRFSRSRHPSVLEPVETLHSPVPMEELLFDLQGANGRRKKARAEEEMERRSRLQAEKELQALADKEIRREEWKQQQEWLRRTLEEQDEKIMALAEQERLREEQQAREEKEFEQKRLERGALECRRQELRQPRTCDTCNGTGKCKACEGSGGIAVTYLSSIVDGTSKSFHGKTFCGCVACGGRQDGGESLELAVLKGHGKCVKCAGQGRRRLGEKEIDAVFRFDARKRTALCGKEMEVISCFGARKQ